MINDDIERVFLDEIQLRAIVDNIAEKINLDYRDQEIVVAGVLKGSTIFLADLFRKLTVRCYLDFITASSYGSGVVSSGNVKITKELSLDISDKHVLIVEDILDTGNTLSYIKEYLKTQNPLSVKICTLLDKPSKRQKPLKPDYMGQVVPDCFLVGYGLDYNEEYRNLPYIGILKEKVYSK